MGGHREQSKPFGKTPPPKTIKIKRKKQQINATNNQASDNTRKPLGWQMNGKNTVPSRPTPSKKSKGRLAGVVSNPFPTIVPELFLQSLDLVRCETFTRLVPALAISWVSFN